MEQNVSIKKNALMNALLSMSALIFPLITFPYVSRILGPEGTGKVSLAMSWVTYFNLIAQLGIPTYGIRACAKVRDNKDELSKTVHELLTINFVLGIIAYLFFLLLILLYHKIRSERLLYIVVSPMIVLNAIGMEWLFKGLEQYEYITKRSIFFKAISVVLMLFMIRTEKDYVLYGALSIFAASASNIVNFFYARKLIEKKQINYNYSKHFKAIGVFFAMSCATVVYTNLDIVMLGAFASNTDVGYYNAAVRIKAILVSIVTSLGSVLLPRASYYIETKQDEKFYYISNKALHFVFMFSIPLVLYFTLFAPYGIGLIAGEKYDGAILPMQVIMPTVFFVGLTNVLGIQMLVPLGKEKTVLYSVIVGAITDAVLNLALIPIYKATGAAIGTVAAELSVLVFQCCFLKDTIKGVVKRLSLVPIVLALVSASLASYWVCFINLDSLSYLMKNTVILLSSCLLFFGVYIIVLLMFGEQMILEAKEKLLVRLKLLKDKVF